MRNEPKTYEHETTLDLGVIGERNCTIRYELDHKNRVCVTGFSVETNQAHTRQHKPVFVNVNLDELLYGIGSYELVDLLTDEVESDGFDCDPPDPHDDYPDEGLAGAIERLRDMSRAVLEESRSLERETAERCK